jgi:hypothetical protein
VRTVSENSVVGIQLTGMLKIALEKLVSHFVLITTYFTEERSEK